MSIGTTGYALYLGALWDFQVNDTRWFLILAGAILGFSASLFWAAQGSIMMSYPMEKDKGRSFSIFWVIFQMGTLLGSAIALGIQFNSTLPSVSTSVYLAFLIIIFVSIVASWLVLPPRFVVRGDGTLVGVQASLSPKEEIYEFLQMFKDWRMLALLPMFFASNYFYAYQGALTTFLFNGRTRALVALLTAVGSMIGSIIIGIVTDTLPFGRRVRAFAGCAFVTMLACGIWAGGLAFQFQFHRDSKDIQGELVPLDWTVGAAVGPILLIFACKFLIRQSLS